jgi:hypothetical protein
LQSGNALKAAGSFARLLTGPASAEARSGSQTALEQCLHSPSLRTNEGAFRLLSQLGTGVNRPAPLVPEAFQRGLALVEKAGPADPDSALKLLDTVALLEPKNESLPQRRIDLLRAVVQAQPTNITRVVELALTYEKAQRMKDCHELLLRHRDHLGSTEGARLLGQHLLQESQYEDAYRLLYPYVQARLTRLHTIEQSYTNAVSGTYRAAVAHLRYGKADQKFYADYDKASKAEKEEMVERFVQQWMQGDANYRRALEQLKDANQIVHVTLDLGIVQLNRAQGFTDPAQRKVELEAAEKSFLAIRGLAGETEEYRLFLGQVYYWLGRAAEGKDLFEQLLASKNRAYPSLMALSQALREVGEDKEARALLEEAYRTGSAGPQKFRAASLRAVVAKDVADKISWLERGDVAEVATQVALNSAKGEQAVEQGRKEAAAGFLRKAIAGYESLTKSAAVLNNTGLAYLTLYEVDGRPEELNRGLSLIEQAVAMAPGNSILMINTTQVLLARALMDLLRDQLRFDLLKEQPNIEAFAFLYDNEAQRREMFQRLRANENMKKAMAYLDRALLLSPKSRSLYREQFYFQAAFEDQTELHKLQQRLRTAQLDAAEYQAESRESWDGAKDGEYLAKLETQIQRYEGLLQVDGVRQHPGTLEYVTVSLNNVRLAALPYGGKSRPRDILRSAEAAYQARHSSATRTSLAAAQYACALETLNRQDPELDALIKRTARVLSPRYLTAFLLDRGGPSSARLRQNEEIQHALALEKEGSRAFPSFQQSDDWALFHTTDAEQAAAAAKNARENPLARLVQELGLELAPTAGHMILDEYWLRKLMGNEQGAGEFYREAMATGVPLPPLGPEGNAANPSSATGRLVDKE